MMCCATLSDSHSVSMSSGSSSFGAWNVIFAFPGAPFSAFTFDTFTTVARITFASSMSAR